MRSRTLLACAAGVLMLTAAACGDDDDSDTSSSASEAPAPKPLRRNRRPPKHPSRPAPQRRPRPRPPAPRPRRRTNRLPSRSPSSPSSGRVLHRHGGRRPGYVDATRGSRSSSSHVRRRPTRLSDRQIRSRGQGIHAMVITPMGNDVIPALDAAADTGLVIVLADNDLGDFTKKTSVAATDNVAGGQLAGEYLKSVLKEGDTIGLMEGVRGVPALDARIQGVQDALEGTGVEIILGGAETKCDSAQGATVAEDLLTREPNLTAIYSACDDRRSRLPRSQGSGQAGHGRRLRRPADRRPGDPRRRHDGDDRQFPPDGGPGSKRRSTPCAATRRGVHRHRDRAGHHRQRGAFLTFQ